MYVFFIACNQLNKRHFLTFRDWRCCLKKFKGKVAKKFVINLLKINVRTKQVLKLDYLDKNQPVCVAKITSLFLYGRLCSSLILKLKKLKVFLKSYLLIHYTIFTYLLILEIVKIISNYNFDFFQSLEELMFSTSTFKDRCDSFAILLIKKFVMLYIQSLFFLAIMYASTYFFA